jgi:hypothetical protein
MSDSCMPCSAPYLAATVSSRGKQVTLQVGRKDAYGEFSVPVALLRECPEYFSEQYAHNVRSSYTAPWRSSAAVSSAFPRSIPHHGGVQHLIRILFFFEIVLTYSRLRRNPYTLERPLAFSKESPDDFRIFIDFLKTGHLIRPNSDESFSFGTLVNIFVFAGDFDILPLRNAAIDAFLLRIIAKPDEIPYHRINDIYKNTSSSSSLRSLVAEVMVNIGSKQEIQDWEHDLPKGFLIDCLSTASDDGATPFSSQYSSEDVAA